MQADSRGGEISSAYQFTDGVVAFLDILGFKQIIESAEVMDNPSALIQYIDEAIVEGLPKSSSQKTQFKIKLFSDCISISTEALPANILMLIRITASIQRNLAQNGIALRGGIAFGKHFENENMIFSKALIKAHMLEKEVAVYPRVLIHSEIHNYVSDDDFAKHKMTYGTNLINSDIDNCIYVDYLDNIKYILETASSTNIHTGCLIALQLHRNCVLQYLEEIKAGTKIGEKYLWMANYLNQKILACPIDEQEKERLSLTDLMS